MSDLVITVQPDGPLHVRGFATLRDKDGTVLGEIRGEARLCRCGRSATAPLCDDTHERCGFTDAPTTPWSGSAGDDAGSPFITVRKGPYFVEARAVVRNAAGEVLAEGTGIVLCRCGASATKPFCDRSHRRLTL